MTVFVFSSEFESFTVVGVPAYTTSTSFFDPDFARAAMQLDAPSAFIAHIQDTPISTGRYWTRGRYHLGSNAAITGGLGSAIQIRDSNGTRVVDLFNNDHFMSTNIWTVRANIGGTMTDISDNLSSTIDNQLIILDLIIDFDTNEIILVANDVELFSAVVSFDNIPDANQWRMFQDPGFGKMRGSEIVIGDEPLTGFNVFTKEPTGNGAVQDQTSGDFTDIDDLALETTTVLTFDSADLEATFTGPPLPVTDRPIRAIMFTDTTRRSETVPNTLNVGYRTNGSQFYPGDHALDNFFTNNNVIVTTNADTGLAFTPAEIDALELAYRSATT